MQFLIVDDHPLFRKAVKNEVQQSFPNARIFEAENGLIALDLLKERGKIDLLILDLSMPVMDGFEVLEKVRRLTIRNLKTIVLTLYDEPFIIHRLLDLGVGAYVSKNENIDILIEAIHTVLNNASYFGPKSDQKVRQLIINKMIPPDLSVNEVLMIRSLAEGKTSKEIANSLGYTIRTVETKRLRLERKMYVKNTAQLIDKAYKLGILKV
jgi:two-component system, NarL family, response regulator NreC